MASDNIPMIHWFEGLYLGFEEATESVGVDPVQFHNFYGNNFLGSLVKSFVNCAEWAFAKDVIKLKNIVLDLLGDWFMHFWWVTFICFF